MELVGAADNATFGSFADLVEDDGAARPEVADDGEQPNKRLRKDRCIWTTELLQKFEVAIRELGINRARPMAILDHMREPGLTKANVKSKLQKYRVKVQIITRNQQEALQGLTMLMSQADPHGGENDARVQSRRVDFRADDAMTMLVSPGVRGLAAKPAMPPAAQPAVPSHVSPIWQKRSPVGSLLCVASAPAPTPVAAAPTPVAATLTPVAAAPMSRGKSTRKRGKESKQKISSTSQMWRMCILDHSRPSKMTKVSRTPATACQGE